MTRTVEQRGVTLVELLVAVAVVAILLVVALPSFEATFRSNRLSVTSNELIASLALARSEAIRNTRSGGICASPDGLTCGDDWNQGWLVWSDRDGNGAIAATEVVRFSQGKDKMQVQGPENAIIFDAQGRADSAVEIVLQPEGCNGQALRRTLRVAGTGQVQKAPMEACQ